MPAEVSCPRCGKPVDPLTRTCPHCGVELALAAVLAERELALPLLPSPGAPLAPEILVPRLGEYLIERGVLSEADLHQALEYHQRLIADGKPRLVGQILLDLGLVDREALDQVITEQILKLQEALQQTNRQLEQRVQERTLELQRALAKLSELNQLKSNFISNISHELRTPLTHLRGYLSLMSEGCFGPLDESLMEACDVMIRAETRLEQLIDDLIEFSLAARGELSLNVAPKNISDIIYTVVARAERVTQVRRINVVTEIAPDLPLVQVDEEKISWVLQQLLDNAIKFTPPEGKVCIQAYKNEHLVFVNLIDTGIGIKFEHIEEIFEPFHQLDSSDTRRYGGVGLGLALARQIIEAHGTTIRVSSEVGKGSQFEFCLPAFQND